MGGSSTWIINEYGTSKFCSPLYNLNPLTRCCACRCLTQLGRCWWCRGMSWLGSQWCRDDRQVPCRGWERTSGRRCGGDAFRSSVAQEEDEISCSARMCPPTFSRNDRWLLSPKRQSVHPFIHTGKGCKRCVNNAQSNLEWRSASLAPVFLRFGTTDSPPLGFPFFLASALSFFFVTTKIL